MTVHFGNQIIPAEFPELKKLVWNRDAACAVSAGEAFALYERNWRFVEREELTPRERDLITELSETYGHGFPLL